MRAPFALSVSHRANRGARSYGGPMLGELKDQRAEVTGFEQQVAEGGVGQQVRAGVDRQEATGWRGFLQCQASDNNQASNSAP